MMGFAVLNPSYELLLCDARTCAHFIGLFRIRRGKRVCHYFAGLHVRFTGRAFLAKLFASTARRPFHTCNLVLTNPQGRVVGLPESRYAARVAKGEASMKEYIVRPAFLPSVSPLKIFAQSCAAEAARKEGGYEP